MTAIEMEAMLVRTKQGMGWVPIEQVLAHVQPQEGIVYRIGLMAGRVDLLLGLVCVN